MRPLALVTGASRGLGKMLSTKLAANGYDLVVTARSERPLKELAQSVGRDSCEIIPLPGDVTDSDHRRTLRRVAAEHGHLELLVNNAAVLGPTIPLIEYPIPEFERVMEVNLKAPLALIQELADELRENGGLIVNVTSDAATEGKPTRGGYGASKAALDLLSKSLANELHGQVSVVSVDPGAMNTDMHQQAFPGEDISDRPTPEKTWPFWEWLFEQKPDKINGQRFEAQGT